MYVLSFDLSTTNTGVAVANINENVLKSLTTEAITPPEKDPTDYGYLKTRKKFRTNKSTYNSYVFPGEKTITKKEAARRDLQLRKDHEESYLNYLTKEISRLVTTYKPTLIVVEANMSFRSMDVTRKLAEVSGALHAIANSSGIPLYKINVNHVRSLLAVHEHSKNVAELYSVEELKHMDLTKVTLKHLMLAKYKAYSLDQNMTLDESDALVILDFWLNKGGVEVGKSGG